MRAAVDKKNFYHENVKEFEVVALKVLTQIYVFGQLKSEKILPESVLSMYVEPTPEGLLREIENSLLKLNRTSGSGEIHYYTEATTSALKMTFVMTQTISEFAPFLNLQDKKLKKILVTTLSEITNRLAPHPTVLSRNTEAGIQFMAKELTPPGIFQKVFSSLKRDKDPMELSQKEIRRTCNRIFE
jgi:hypothetical protein